MIREFFGLQPVPEHLVWLRRKETWAGDVKANKIRMVAIVLFALNEMVTYHLLKSATWKFHTESLLISLLWFIAAVDCHFMLKKHWLPKKLPYLMPGLDVLLLTWMLNYTKGPQSPLVVIYFLIIALSCLRLNPGLVYYTTALCCGGYLITQNYARLELYENLVPTHQLIIVLLSMVILGTLCAHAIGRVFTLIEGRQKTDHA